MTYESGKCIVEATEWNPSIKLKRGRIISESVAALHNLKVSEVKRIIHYDVKCAKRYCSLRTAINSLQRKGCKLEYYHEKPGILVVRRNQDESGA